MAAPAMHDERIFTSMPPRNVGYALDHGLRDIDRWRVPLLLRLDPDVSPAHVRAALTAVINHHVALRTSYVAHDGTWVQRIADPQDFDRLSIVTLGDAVAADSQAERDAVATVMSELMSESSAAGPLSAAYIAPVDGGRPRLAIALHRLVCDESSVGIVASDTIIAISQQVAGEPIVLAPVSTLWTECAAGLDEQPSVELNPTLRVTDFDADGAPGIDDLHRISAPLSGVLSRELEGAARELGVPVEHLLLAALGRAVQRTIGGGVVTVDVTRPMRAEFGTDLGRTVGPLPTTRTIALGCVGADEVDATQMVLDVRAAIAAAVPRESGPVPSELSLSYVGPVPDPIQCDLPAQIDGDWAAPVREVVSGFGHAVELRACRSGGVMYLDWWYDARRCAEYTIEELAEQFPHALVEITSESIPEFVGAA
ncbi:condensation domain-containing protein [Mycobacterium sp. AMU20-3851]|uniref:condensation domain-containing protein n=1 Tax=Mycobacterium sp. AMU20-3851 TaxID=3122055 RepID=UPI0037543C38